MYSLINFLKVIKSRMMIRVAHIALIEEVKCLLNLVKKSQGSMEDRALYGWIVLIYTEKTSIFLLSYSVFNSWSLYRCIFLVLLDSQ